MSQREEARRADRKASVAAVVVVFATLLFGLPASAAPDPSQPPAEPLVAGRIERARVDDAGVATLRGWAFRLDAGRATWFAVRVDDRRVGRVRAHRLRPEIAEPAGIAHPIGFRVDIPLASGAHRVCLYDAAVDQTVDCVRVATRDHLGLLVTPTGVPVKLLEARGGDRWLVESPCSRAVVVDGGRRVRTAQILVDPGHGGVETGAVGFNRLVERDLNLAVARRVRRILKGMGYSVLLTRSDDHQIPVPMRGALAEALAPDAFVSIHHNGGGAPPSSDPGTQVYFDNGEAESRRLSGILYEELYSAATRFQVAWVGTSVDGAVTRLLSDGQDWMGIHRTTPNVTSVLTEWMWLDNPSEAALLAQPEVQEVEAAAIARGIDRWYRTRDPGSGYRPPFVDDTSTGYPPCVDPALQ